MPQTENFSLRHNVFNFTQLQFFSIYLPRFFQRRLLPICCMWKRINFFKTNTSNTTNNKSAADIYLNIIFFNWSFMPLSTLFQLYHVDSSLIHDPWVNKPVLRLENMPCPRSLNHDRRAATGDRTRDIRLQIPNANHGGFLSKH